MRTVEQEISIETDLEFDLREIEEIEERPAGYLANSLARHLGLSLDDTIDLLADLGYEPEEVGTHFNRREIFSLDAVQRLNVEIKIHNLPELVTISDVAKVCNRSVDFIKDKFMDREFVIDGTVVRSGNVVDAYKKSGEVEEFIRNDFIQSPPANGRVNLQQILDETNFDRDWILARFKENGWTSRPCRSERTGQTTPHYARYVIVLLKAEANDRPEYPPVGWMTAKNIAAHLHTTQDRIERIIRNHSDQCEGKIFMAENRQPAVYYSPDTIDYIEGIIQNYRELPRCSEGYRTIPQMAAELNRSTKWIQKRIAPYEEQGVLMRNEYERQAIHWPDWVFQEFKELSDADRDVQDADDDDVTLTQAAEMLGVGRYQASRLLREAGISKRKRINNAGRASDHYSASRVAQVRDGLQE
jgi:hypothetical protein